MLPKNFPNFQKISKKKISKNQVLNVNDEKPDTTKEFRADKTKLDLILAMALRMGNNLLEKDNNYKESKRLMNFNHIILQLERKVSNLESEKNEILKNQEIGTKNLFVQKRSMNENKRHLKKKWKELEIAINDLEKYSNSTQKRGKFLNLWNEELKEENRLLKIYTQKDFIIQAKMVKMGKIFIKKLSEVFIPYKTFAEYVSKFTKESFLFFLEKSPQKSVKNFQTMKEKKLRKFIKNFKIHLDNFEIVQNKVSFGEIREMINSYVDEKDKKIKNFGRV